MLYIKDNYPQEQYEKQFGELWQSYWKEHIDISKPENMKLCLQRHFSDSEADEILKGGTSPKYKKLLTDETARLVEKGAFGAPWYLVTNKEGLTEPFFGSDRYISMSLLESEMANQNRFHYMLQYLEIPFNDIAIQPNRGARL
jgi:2-hydroxychromene-2-carboxylate isomerase